jgi:CRP/FNR family cyclic AMP-dependent transcriptional regulator
MVEVVPSLRQSGFIEYSLLYKPSIDRVADRRSRVKQMAEPNWRKVQALQDSAWFRDFPSNAIEALASAGTIRLLNDRECLLREGDVSAGIGLILRGGIRSGSLSVDGHEFAFSLLKPGAIVGLVSALDGLGAVNNATAHGETEALVIPRSALIEVLDTEPLLYRHVVKMLCYRMRKAYCTIDELALVPLRQRLARQICTLVEAEHGGESPRGEVVLDITQGDLAILLGATRPIVNRALKELEGEGLIAAGYRKLIVKDFSVLYSRCVQQKLFAL